MKPIQDKLYDIDNVGQRHYMLGDVVMYNRKPIIIASLTIYSQGLTQYVNYPNGQKLKFIDSTKVEPILLTEKILEANGFAYEKTKKRMAVWGFFPFSEKSHMGWLLGKG